MGPLMVHRGWFRGEVDLWTCEVVKTESVAALSVASRALRRSSWTATEELAADGQWSRTRSEPTALVWQESRDMTVLRTLSWSNCTTCLPGNQGWIECPICSPLITASPVLVACHTCNGSRRIKCKMCDGSLRTMMCEVEYSQQHIDQSRALLLPDLPRKLSWWLFELLRNDPSPEMLKVELERYLSMGPYRQASAEREADFCGYSFHGTLEKARQSVQATRARPDVLLSDFVAFARPILLVRFREGDRLWDVGFATRSDGVCFAHAARVNEQHP